MSWNKLFKLKLLVIFSVPIAFFIIGVFTLSHYGISWDESFHFQRGQAYLHYFITREKDFLKIPAYPRLRGDSDFMGRMGEQDIYVSAQKSVESPLSSIRRSYYQSDVFTFSFLTAGFDGGHPPASDILSALFNYIFYQKLGVIGDIESYHLFEIVISALLILAIGIFVNYNFGLLPALIASLSLALYPLFFTESHFNIKDPPEAAFFGFTIIFFFFGIVKENWRFVVLSGIFAGLAIGTKFNALFLPFILIPWFVARLILTKSIPNKSILKTLLIVPIIACFLFLISWPYLWEDLTGNLVKVFDYYKSIGLGTQPGMEKYIFGGFNTYPLQWIIYTTPLPILILGVIGTGYSVFLLFSKKKDIFLLILLWLSIPIIRVSLPNTNIYGGVRQIMEFIPALAVLCGVGTYFLTELEVFRKIKKLIAILLTVIFLFVGWELYKIHPNENVYFNQLIGGLSGAAKQGIPSWGNSYGNVYLQGVQWLNQNAEKNARLGLPINNMVNVPRIKLRSDIYFSNAYPTGSARQGEYVMEMAHDWEPKKWYGFVYYDTFLTPVYEIKVDNVPLLKIWKNDLQHTKPGFTDEKEYKVIDFKVENNRITVNLEKEIFLTKLEIKHDNKGCDTKQIGGYVRLSGDGMVWNQEPESIDYPQVPMQWLGKDENTFVFLFPARKARFILLDTENQNSCILKNPKIKVYGLSRLTRVNLK